MYIDKNGDKWYKVGLHTHTTLSDGKKTPEEMARIYKNAGYDAVAITDHWVYGEEKEIDGLKIISGCEYNLGGSDTSADTMHIVGFGMDKKPELTRDSSRQEVIDKIKECGGFAVLAHPHWSLNSIDEIKELNGFSFVEIYNAVSEVYMSNRADSGCIIDLLANDGVTIPLIATDDVHYYNDQDNCRGFVMVKAESGEIKDILAALKKGDYYSSQGPYLSVRREGDTVFAECSPCKTVAFMSNSAWEPDRMVRADWVESAQHLLKPYEKWLRVEVTDKFGNRAWSNIITLK